MNRLFLLIGCLILAAWASFWQGFKFGLISFIVGGVAGGFIYSIASGLMHFFPEMVSTSVITELLEGIAFVGIVLIAVAIGIGLLSGFGKSLAANLLEPQDIN